ALYDPSRSDLHPARYRFNLPGRSRGKPTRLLSRSGRVVQPYLADPGTRRRILVAAKPLFRRTDPHGTGARPPPGWPDRVEPLRLARRPGGHRWGHASDAVPGPGRPHPGFW